MLRIFFIIILIYDCDFVNSAVRKTPKLKLNSNYTKMLTAINNLESKISKEDLQMILTLGLVQGALGVKRNMERNLTETVADLVLNLDMTNMDKSMPKIDRIERMMDRDRHSVEVLGGALDFARKAITAREFHMDMRKMYHERNKKLRMLRDSQDKGDIRSRLEHLKKDILEHVDVMHTVIDGKTNATIDYLKKKLNLNVDKDAEDVETASTSDESVLNSILMGTMEQNLVDASRRADVEVVLDKNEKETQQKQEYPTSEEFLENGPPPGPGGLVGLIASLSGGEQGSDVGALFGAVTGLVMNLFGPNGLDVQSLLASGTALLSGLLAGDRNFGSVLAEYLGTAVDGFSGGGGAALNGKFFGRFLGTLIAQLSADPEDDDQPIRPQLFLRNFITSFMNAKNKMEDPEEEEDEDGGGGGNDQRDTGSGSDSFGFIKHIVGAVVKGVTSFILNSSLGSSGGSSQGSAGLLSASSGPKKH